MNDENKKRKRPIKTTKSKKKTRTTKKTKKKKKEKLPPLSKEQQSLVDDFEIIDRMWCFLSKRKALTSANVIMNLARSATGKVLTIERLRVVCDVAPDVLMLAKESTESCIFAKVSDDATTEMIQMTTLINHPARSLRSRSASTVMMCRMSPMIQLRQTLSQKI